MFMLLNTCRLFSKSCSLFFGFTCIGRECATAASAEARKQSVLRAADNANTVSKAAAILHEHQVGQFQSAVASADSSTFTARNRAFTCEGCIVVVASGDHRHLQLCCIHYSCDNNRKMHLHLNMELVQIVTVGAAALLSKTKQLS